jgi:hypothetical protein
MRIPMDMAFMVKNLHLHVCGRWVSGEAENRYRLFWWPAKYNKGPFALDVLIEWDQAGAWQVYVEGATPEQEALLPSDRLGWMWPIDAPRPAMAEARRNRVRRMGDFREAREWGASKGYEQVGDWVWKHGRWVALYRTPWGFVAGVSIQASTGEWKVKCRKRGGFDLMGVPPERRFRHN